jgi:LAO/AO transport system kinase
MARSLKPEKLFFALLCNGNGSTSSYESALKVNDGIPQPPSVDEASASRFINLKRKNLMLKNSQKAYRRGDRMVLSKAITMVESAKHEHQEVAQK